MLHSVLTVRFLPCAMPSAAYTPTLKWTFSWVWFFEASLVHWLSQMFAPMAAALWQPYRKQMNTASRGPTALTYSRYTFVFTWVRSDRTVNRLRSDEVSSQSLVQTVLYWTLDYGSRFYCIYLVRCNAPWNKIMNKKDEYWLRILRITHYSIMDLELWTQKWAYSEQATSA